MELCGFRRALLLAGLAVCGIGGLAQRAAAHPPADDYQPYAPSGFFVYDWSGPYVGGNLGLAHTNAEATEQIFPDDILLFDGLNYDQSETSVTGGVQAGWQKQWGKLVLGAEIGFSLLRFDTTKPSPIIDGLDRSVEVSDIFSLTGRLGYADGRWLAYAKGGLVNARVDVGYDDQVTGLSTSSSDRETGWTAGVGIEYALSQSLVLGIEYNFMNFHTDVVPPTILDPIAQTEVPTHFDGVDVDIQSLVVRLNYRFNTPTCCIGPGGPYGP